MENSKINDFIDKIQLILDKVDRDPMMEYLVKIENEGGGHITVTQVLDFLKHQGYYIPNRIHK